MASISRETLDTQGTIFALASGSLPCAVAMIRLSGDHAFPFAVKHFRSASGKPFHGVRGMDFGDLVDAQGQKIDSIVLLCFKGPNSFTGQDVIEIQCHGSVAVVHRIEALLVENGCRPAKRGEFSWRAHQLGRLDASELESLGDVFLAQDPSDLDRIYLRTDPAMENEMQRVREDLIRLQAILDTAVDFSEEYGHVAEMARRPINAARDKCLALADRYTALKSGQRVPRLVLAGRPNAGKSSLFNALLCRYRAIVHESEGTTRDAIEEDIELSGRRWKLTDTAGIRPAQTEAERQGIELGSHFLEGASFWVLVVDGTLGLSQDETALLSRYASKPHLIVWNKKDFPGFLAPKIPETESVVAVSALKGDSVRELAAVLESRVQSVGDRTSVLPSATQTSKLRQAVEHLADLEADLEKGVTPEILGEKNRTLLRHLDSVVGTVDVEQVLDRVFSEFCIGK